MEHANEDSTTTPPKTGLQLQSLISSSGTLELSLEAKAIDPPMRSEGHSALVHMVAMSDLRQTGFAKKTA